MHISRIYLENIRGFQELEINLTLNDQKPRPLTLFIGKNGTCKSTLLRAIVIGLCNEADAHSLLSEPFGSLITEHKWKAKIEIDLVNTQDSGNPITITTYVERREDDIEFISREGEQNNRERVLSNLSKKLFLCGYGAGRSVVGPDAGRLYRVADSAYGLFDYRHTVIDPELTLRRLADHYAADYERAMQGIKRILGLSTDDEIRPRKGGGVVVSGNLIGESIPLQAWADGYRMTLNWLLDLYAWAIRTDKITPSGSIRGVVLIDELEQHLHPSLQIEMPNRLKEYLPEVQFFATTHSPHIILGTSHLEVVSLRRKGDIVEKVEPVPDISGYSAEDILVDEFLFDTGAYSPEMNRKLERYRELTSIPESDRNSDQVKELRELARELRKQQIPEVLKTAIDPEVKKILEKYDL